MWFVFYCCFRYCCLILDFDAARFGVVSCVCLVMVFAVWVDAVVNSVV